ncbi:MAG: MFS transporter [Nocardioidaceae bacterium]
MVDVPVADGRVRQLRGLDGFRRLLSVRLTSQLGDGLFAAGLTWLVLLSPERRQSPEEVAVAAAVLLLPFSLVGPFTGVFLDRWSRQRVLMWGQPVRIALALGLIAAADRTSLVVAYALAIGALGVNRFLLAALSAGLPHVVPRQLLLTANALAPTAGTVAAVIGFGLGGGLLAILGDVDGGTGSTAALLAGAAGFGAASLLAGRLGRQQLGPDRQPDQPRWTQELGVVVTGLRQGLRHLVRRPAAGRALVMIGSHRFWFGLWTVQVAMLALHGDNDRDLPAAAFVATAAGAGILVAAVITPPGRRRVGDRGWITALLAVSAVAIGVCTPIAGVPPLMVAGFVCGLAAQGLKICVDTAVQRHVDDDYLGRAFAIYDVVFNVVFVGAAALATLLVPTSGASLPATILSATGLAATALWYRFFCHDGATSTASIDR